LSRKGIDIEPLKEEPELLLNFLREMRKAAFYNSNIFFRDIQHSIRDYFEAEEGKSVTIPQAEHLAREVLTTWMDKGVIKQVAPNAFVLLHKDYLTPKEGTIGLMNVPLSDLPASAIPMPHGMPAVSTAVASPTPAEVISTLNGDPDGKSQQEEVTKPAPPPWLQK
jgi:hypothetical protein